MNDDSVTTALELTVRTRIQLLWMDFAVARSYYVRFVEPTLRSHWSARGHACNLELCDVTITRENYHNRLVEFRVRVVLSSLPSSLSSSSPNRRYLANELELIDTISRRSDRPGMPTLPPASTVESRMLTLADTLLATVPPTTVSSTTTTTSSSSTFVLQPPTTAFDFWQDTAWWRARVSSHWYDHPYRRNPRRVTHLLNQLTRLLRQIYRVDTTRALRAISRLTVPQIELIDRLFVEPIDGSLIASHLSTIFMHSEQQTGLNTKHEATRAQHSSIETLQSARPFDAKLYLKMCTSRVNRDIFEIMLRLRLAAHHGDDPVDEKQKTGDGRNHRDLDEAARRTKQLFCRCDDCRVLRGLANAWRYYDCRSDAWLRLEIPRNAYRRTCEVLQRMGPDAVQLIYTSDKTEFTDERLFVDNFVNYYAFYENGQHPLVIAHCYGRMRTTVSVLYVFAVVNWVMIVDWRKRNRNNSISLNQQSLCKSLDNTLYSIFSENCINRVRAEVTRRAIRDNAAYVNRGLGLVSNTGVNAFNLSHTVARVVPRRTQDFSV